MQQPRDYYRILGLTPDASQDEIKRAYRLMAMQHHPDRNRDDPSSGERLKEINEAYGVLGDLAKRRAYDRIRILHTQGHPFTSSRFVDVDLESMLRRVAGWDLDARGRRFCGKRGFGRGRCRRR